MSLALYRKYRPNSFAEVVGQEHVVQTITNAIGKDMISHAYLFSGPRGSGKTTIARLLAKSVNCMKRKGTEPCNTCEHCTEINAHKAMDIIEIDAASNRGIDEIRQLKEGIGFTPTRLPYKVFIIDEVHQLTKEASNALLKTLEEPPAHALFILATTEPQKMIATILSRCQHFAFGRLTVEQIATQLEVIAKQEHVKAEKEVLEIIASRAQGSLRDAISLLDQAIIFCTDMEESKKKKTDTIIDLHEIKELLHVADVQSIASFMDFLIAKDTSSAISHIHTEYEKGMDPEIFTSTLLNYLRFLLLAHILGEDLSKIPSTIEGATVQDMKKLKEQAKKISERDLKITIKAFLEAQDKLKYASIPQLPLEIAVIESCTNNKTPDA